MNAPTFRGVTLISVDTKGRMAMPSKHRQMLQAYCENQLVLTAFPDKCLLLYPSARWPEIESQLLGLPNRSEIRSLQRLLIGYASECAMDSNGRFLLPPMLREFARIDGQAVLVGQGKRFELWNSQGWKSQELLAQEQNARKDVNEALEKILL